MIDVYPSRENINAHIAQLAGSDRGLRVLAALAGVSRDLVHLDKANSEAFASLAIAFVSHEFNGTLINALNPYGVDLIRAKIRVIKSELAPLEDLPLEDRSHGGVAYVQIQNLRRQISQLEAQLIR